MGVSKRRLSLPCSFRCLVKNMLSFSNPCTCQAFFFFLFFFPLWSRSNYLDTGIDLCCSLFSFSSICKLCHTHVNVYIIYFRVYSCSLTFTLYQSYWMISIQVLKKPPVILAVTLLPFKSAFRITLFWGSFQMHLLPLTKASWFVCAIFSIGKHNCGQQNNHAAENAVCSLAVAMRMQVSVTSNIVHFLLFLRVVETASRI